MKIYFLGNNKAYLINNSLTPTKLWCEDSIKNSQHRLSKESSRNLTPPPIINCKTHHSIKNTRNTVSPVSHLTRLSDQRQTDVATSINRRWHVLFAGFLLSKKHNPGPRWFPPTSATSTSQKACGWSDYPIIRTPLVSFFLLGVAANGIK